MQVSQLKHMSRFLLISLFTEMQSMLLHAFCHVNFLFAVQVEK